MIVVDQAPPSMPCNSTPSNPPTVSTVRQTSFWLHLGCSSFLVSHACRQPDRIAPPDHDLLGLRMSNAAT